MRLSRTAGRVLVFALGIVLGAPLVRAQVPPTSGGVDLEMRRQQERMDRQGAPARSQEPGVVAPPRRALSPLQPGGPAIKLRSITFEGASIFLSGEELAEAVAPYKGKKVTLADLQQMIAAINALYAAKGASTAIATLPPQDVKDGVIKVKLTEGRLDKLQVTGNDRTETSFILGRIVAPSGEVLDVPRLSRDVTWFNRTHDTQVRASLQPGANFGLTDVNLAVTEAPVNTLQVFTDNQGVDSVGRLQYGTYYKRSGLLGLDDRLTLYATKSVEAQGNLNGNIAYNLPFNTSGGRVGVSYTQGRTRVIHGAYAALKSEGESRTAAINLSQPFWVDEQWLVQGNLASSYGVSESRLKEAKTADTGTAKQTLGLAATRFGEDYSINLTPTLNIATTRALASPTQTVAIGNVSASGFMKLPAGLSLSSLGNGQFTSARPLAGDLLFQAGGPTTVRGYPSNAAAGYSGYYANLELHWNVAEAIAGLDVYGFLDRGEVFSTFPQHQRLTSAGAGLNWTIWPALTMETFFGVPFNAVLPAQPKHEAYVRLVMRPLQLWSN